MSSERFPQRSIPGAMRSFWTGGQAVEHVAYVVAGLLFVSGLIHLTVLVVTGASWTGPLSLRKPATFGLSFGLTLMTITWVALFLRLAPRAKTVLLGAFTGACVLETMLVSMQTWRGVPSHFNVETSFDALVTRMLAGGGVVLIVTIFAFAVAAFRVNPTVPISLRVAIRVGFVALLGSLGIGGFMIAKGMALVVGGDPQAAYLTGGTLKATHAVTMHAILVLPALAWLLSFADWSEQGRLGMVLVASAGYLVLIGAVAAGNIGGVDMSRMLIVALLSLGILLLVATAVLVLRAVIRATALR